MTQQLLLASFAPAIGQRHVKRDMVRCVAASGAAASDAIERLD